MQSTRKYNLLYFGAFAILCVVSLVSPCLNCARPPSFSIFLSVAAYERAEMSDDTNKFFTHFYGCLCERFANAFEYFKSNL